MRDCDAEEAWLYGVRSLRCMVRMAVHEGTFSSSPGIDGLVIPVSQIHLCMCFPLAALRSLALVTQRNALSPVHGSPMLDAALPGFVGSRGIHSRVISNPSLVAAYLNPIRVHAWFVFAHVFPSRQPRRRRPSAPVPVTRRVSLSRGLWVWRRGREHGVYTFW